MTVGKDAAVAAIFGHHQDTMPGSNGDKQRNVTPHAQKRSARMMSVTFRSAAWVEAIQALASRWDVRTSDVMAFCVAYTFEAIEGGRVAQPNSEAARFHQRAGECMNLPWRPQGENE